MVSQLRAMIGVKRRENCEKAQQRLSCSPWSHVALDGAYVLTMCHLPDIRTMSVLVDGRT